MKRLLCLVSGVAFLGMIALGTGCKWESKTHINPADEQAKETKKQEALAEAQKTLPSFWTRFDAYEGTDATYSVKVRFTDSAGNTENLWVGSFQRIGEGRCQGGLADAPKKLVGFKQFQIVQFDIADVVDWWILKQGGASEGRFTGYD